MELICKSLEETKKLGEIFAGIMSKCGAFVSLYGEIGAGKTTFTKYVLETLKVSERVTSPSFVILNEYHSGELPVYHFDLYRLENEGLKTISEELREYSREGVLTLVEWAEYGRDELPFEKISISITYGDNEEERVFKFNAEGEKNKAIIKEVERQWKS